MKMLQLVKSPIFLVLFAFGLLGGFCYWADLDREYFTILPIPPTAAPFQFCYHRDYKCPRLISEGAAPDIIRVKVVDYHTVRLSKARDRMVRLPCPICVGEE